MLVKLQSLAEHLLHKAQLKQNINTPNAVVTGGGCCCKHQEQRKEKSTPLGVIAGASVDGGSLGLLH